MATDQIPQYLYKYLSFASPHGAAAIENAIVNRRVYFPYVSQFNDPMEMSPVLVYEGSPKALRKDYERLIKLHAPAMTRERRRSEARSANAGPLHPKNLNATRLSIQRKSAQVFAQQTTAYCLTEENENLLMWAHYADSHKGVCLQFRADRSLGRVARKVVYSTDRPKAEQLSPKKFDQLFASAITKSSDWKYEKEWRVFGASSSSAGYRRIDEDELTGVILGAAIDPVNRESVLNWIASSPTKLGLYKAKFSDEYYRVDVEA